MRELKPGVWHWQSPHPEWDERQWWPQLVSSYAIGTVLFDPLDVPDELAERATAIVLTAPWHERDTQRLVERFGLPVYSPRADTAQDLMEQFGISAERAGDGSPDLKWLTDRRDDLPPGIEEWPGQKHNDRMLWVESARAVVCGDTLSDFGEGFRLNEHWNLIPRDEVAAALRPLLDKPVEWVLPAHGEPLGRDALERALG